MLGSIYLARLLACTSSTNEGTKSSGKSATTAITSLFAETVLTSLPPFSTMRAPISMWLSGCALFIPITNSAESSSTLAKSRHISVLSVLISLTKDSEGKMFGLRDFARFSSGLATLKLEALLSSFWFKVESPKVACAVWGFSPSCTIFVSFAKTDLLKVTMNKLVVRNINAINTTKMGFNLIFPPSSFSLLLCTR